MVFSIADVAQLLGAPLRRSELVLGRLTRGLLAGNNHPSDIDGLINLYRRFYWWRPFAEAVDDWRIADAQVEELVGQALRLHERVTEGKLTEATRRDALRRIEVLDEAITRREDTFSTHMGEASRLATMLVVITTDAAVSPASTGSSAHRGV